MAVSLAATIVIMLHNGVVMHLVFEIEIIAGLLRLNYLCEYYICHARFTLHMARNIPLDSICSFR